MHTHPLIAGIDVGTTNVKALIAEPDGTVRALASAPTPTQHPRPGWASFDPDEIWSTVCEVLTRATGALSEPDRIASVAVASVGETAFPVDADGQALDQGIAWFDTRSQPQADWLREHIGAERIYETCRMSIQPIYGLCKLLWLRDNRPDTLARTSAWLNVADYVAFRLSGAQATDPSLASRALMFDVDQFDWALDLLNDCGIDPGLLSPLERSGEAIGTVLSSAAKQTGLPEGAIVATGGHDHICGALAVGVTEPGTVLNSLGTAEAHLVPIDRPLNRPEVARQGYSVGGHVARDRYYAIGGLYTSGGSVNWVNKLLGTRDIDPGEAASSVPAGCGGVYFMPHLRIANPPFGDAPSRGAFVGLTGDVDRSVMYRAVLEGIAFESKLCLDGLLSYAEQTPDTLIAIGGSTRNHLLMQIKASVYRTPITVSETEEGTALGAAILGGLGSGIYSDTQHVRETVERRSRQIEPDVSLASRYAELFETYAQIYPSLKELNARIESQNT